MARTRSIKPSFFTNDVLAELPPLTRLLFIGLWTLADCVGRLEDRPKQIKAKVLPWDDLDVDDALGALERAGFIQRYQVDGVPAIAVLKFALHQHPHVNEKPANLPAPPKTGAKTETLEIIGPAREKAGPETDQGLHRSGLVLGTCNLELGTGDGEPEDAPTARAPVAILNPHAKPTNLVNGHDQRRHGMHAWCEFDRLLCVPLGIHTEFKGRGLKSDEELEAWYRQVVDGLSGQPVGDDTFAFWRQQFAAWIGTVAPAARKLTRNEEAVAAGQRVLAEIGGRP